jgi:hypothetical protein
MGYKCMCPGEDVCAVPAKTACFKITYMKDLQFCIKSTPHFFYSVYSDTFFHTDTHRALYSCIYNLNIL